MDKQTVQNIMGFMMRVQLTGQEVPAFNASMNALQNELNKTSEYVKVPAVPGAIPAGETISGDEEHEG